MNLPNDLINKILAIRRRISFKHHIANIHAILAPVIEHTSIQYLQDRFLVTCGRRSNIIFEIYPIFHHYQHTDLALANVVVQIATYYPSGRISFSLYSTQ